MARRPDDKPRRGGRSAHGSNQPRSVVISKAFSKLLRHQAQNEHIPISPEGWVKVSDALSWRGLDKIVRGGEAQITLQEIAGIVADNDKKRLALLWTKDPRQTHDTNETAERTEDLGVADLVLEETSTTTGNQAAEEDTATNRAVSAIVSGTDTEPSHYLIRAVQGHSMRSIGTDDLLTPITLSTLDSITADGLVVHGTFYGAWSAILTSGGLKSMGRNHVHFATGPRLDEILPDDGDDSKNKAGGEVAQKLERNKVISGMRTDAQILIYVNVKRALQEMPEMQWWRSENGVVLTEGLAARSNDNTQSEHAQQETVAVDAQAGNKEAQDIVQKGKAMSQGEFVKIVPMSCWETVVEVKQGYGVIWTRAEGLIKELPERLLNRAMPPGKGRGAAGKSGMKGRGR